MNKIGRQRGFSVIELIVVCGVLSVLSGMTVMAVSRARESVRDTRCASHLQQIGLALHQFAEVNDDRMPVHLQPHLDPYVEANPSVWKCPNDDSTVGNSYTDFYLPRYNTIDTAGAESVIRCPRHPMGEGWLELALERTTTAQSKTAALPEGQYLEDVPTATAMPENSTIKGHRLMILKSQQEGSLKRWHIIIGLEPTPSGDTAWGEFHVTPGTRFEVYTPAGIAAVEGTRFRVESNFEAPIDQYFTKVVVTEGRVRVKGFDEKSGVVLGPGQTRTLKRGRLESWPRGIRDKNEPLAALFTPITGGPVSIGPTTGPATGPTTGPVLGGPISGPVLGGPISGSPTSGGPISTGPATGGPISGSPTTGSPTTVNPSSGKPTTAPTTGPTTTTGPSTGGGSSSASGSSNSNGLSSGSGSSNPGSSSGGNGTSNRPHCPPRIGYSGASGNRN